MAAKARKAQPPKRGAKPAASPLVEDNDATQSSFAADPRWAEYREALVASAAAGDTLAALDVIDMCVELLEANLQFPEELRKYLMRGLRTVTFDETLPQPLLPTNRVGRKNSGDMFFLAIAALVESKLRDLRPKTNDNGIKTIQRAQVRADDKRLLPKAKKNALDAISEVTNKNFSARRLEQILKIYNDGLDGDPDPLLTLTAAELEGVADIKEAFGIRTLAVSTVHAPPTAK